MYQVELTESYCPAQSDEVVLEVTVGDALRAAAHDRPDTFALIEINASGERGAVLSYQALLNRCEVLARALTSRFSKGERVVVWAHNVPEWLVMEYACALAGVVLVPANPSFRAKELRYVLQQSGAVGLFLVKDYRGNPMGVMADEAVQGLNLREVTYLTDQDAMLRGGDFPHALPQVQPGDPFQIQYTSGTTGFPKGAVIHHRGLYNNGRFVAGRALMHEGSVLGNFMPMFHTAGCGIGGMAALAYKIPMVLFHRFDSDDVVRVIEEEGITTCFAVPTMLVGMLEALQRCSRNMNTMELIISGAAPVAPELVRAVRAAMNCQFETAFGQTEQSPVICQNWADGTSDDISFSAGQPLPQTEASIRDSKTDAILPVGQVGEICARGYGVMLGYHDRPDASAQAIDEHGWLHTGDLGTMDSRGVIRITGRIKDMIIRGGENHFPAEIESALLEHSSVAEVAVVGLPDSKWGEIIGAFVRSNGNRPIDVEALRQHTRQLLSPQKTPVVWCQVVEFPLTGSGKIQKFVIRDRFVAGEYQEVNECRVAPLE